MLAIRLPPEIEQRLEALAKRTGRSKSYYVRAAILEYLGDLEDIHLAEHRLAKLRRRGSQTVGIAELEERYGAPSDGPTLQLTAVLIPDRGGGYTALNPETGTTSQGDSIDKALANLREATELYLEQLPAPHSGNTLLTTLEVTLHA